MKTIDDYFKNYSELYQFEEGKPEYLVDREYFKDAMLEYGREILIEAANKVKLKTEKVLWDDPKEGEDAYMYIELIDKDSILTLINELK